MLLHLMRLATFLLLGLTVGVAWGHDVEEVGVIDLLPAHLVALSREAQDDSCRRDANLVVQEARKLTLWALRIADASGKLNAGILKGNIKMLGHFDECLEASGDEVVRGRYCLASVNLRPKEESPRKVILEGLLHKATLGKLGLEVASNRSHLPKPDLLPTIALMQLGVCVPSSCDLDDVQVALSNTLHRTLDTLGLHVTAELPTDACSDSQSIKLPWRKIDSAFLVILSVLVLLTATATLRDMNSKENKEGWQVALCAFSIPANWHRLTRPAVPSSIRCVDGLRVICTLWVILAHKVISAPTIPHLDADYLFSAMRFSSFMPLSNAMPCVDAFFFMAGLLRAYSLHKELDARPYQPIKDAIRRYLRLTPPMAAMILFYATMLPRMGSGPLWKKFVGDAGSMCEINWLNNLLYINNWVHVHQSKYCILQTWHLAADMHLFLLAPILVIPMWRWSHLAPSLILGSCGVATASAFAYIYATAALPTFLLGASDFKLVHYQNNVHYQTSMRFAPYIVGLGLAVLLRNDAKLRLRQPLVAGGWIVCLTLLYAVVYGPLDMMQIGYQYEPLKVALVGSLQRPAFALGLAWIVIACYSGNAGWVNTFLSWKSLQPISRLSYCMFLTHFAILLVNLGQTRTSLFKNELMLIREFVGDVMVTLVFSLMLHLLVEAPTLQLVSAAFAEGKKPLQTKEVEETAAPTEEEHPHKQLFWNKCMLHINLEFRRLIDSVTGMEITKKFRPR